MEAFLIGATGYIGGSIADQLLQAGHKVTALVRSDTSDKILKEKGMDTCRGNVDDPSTWVSTAVRADTIIFSWLDRDPARFEAADSTAVRTVLKALAGTQKSLVYVTGSLGTGDTGLTEVDEFTPNNPIPAFAWRSELEEEIRGSAESGVRSVVVRAPMVYGKMAGFVTNSLLTDVASSGKIHYVGSGDNLLAFVHVEDLADLCVRAAEGAPAGSLYLAANGERMTYRNFATLASSILGADGETASIPLEVATQLMGPFAEALTYSQVLSTAAARQQLGWAPTKHGVAEELKRVATHRNK
jgi:nucleoside-diphosphate-sugar epimerase